MLWPSSTIWLKAGSRPSGSYICLAWVRRFPQAGGGDRDRYSGRIHVEQELVLLLDLGIALKLVEHRDPGQRAGDQPVDHDHRDLARLVRPEQQEIGPFERLSRVGAGRSSDSVRGRSATTYTPAESSSRSRGPAGRPDTDLRRSARGSKATSVQTRAFSPSTLGSEPASWGRGTPSTGRPSPSG